MGGEYIFQKNYLYNPDHCRYGYSLYSTYAISDKWEVFARLDRLKSNAPSAEIIPWNQENDGSAIKTGFQYSPMEVVHISLNYQDWFEETHDVRSAPFLFLNFEIVF